MNVPHSQLLIQPQVQHDLTEAIDTTISTLDEVLSGMTRGEKAEFLTTQIGAIQQITSSITQAMLHVVWRVLSEQLWQEPLRDGTVCDSFRDWIDVVAGPTFKKRGRNGNPTPSWMADVVRIAERTLVYAMVHPIKDANGELITPTYLIENVKFGKLKITSNDFLDTVRTPERDAELRDLTSKAASTLRVNYTTPRIPVIHYALNIAPTGASDILMMGLSPNQVALVRTALGRMVSEHAIHLSSADREALLNLLIPAEAQNQYEREGDE